MSAQGGAYQNQLLEKYLATRQKTDTSIQPNLAKIATESCVVWWRRLVDIFLKTLETFERTDVTFSCYDSNKWGSRDF